MVAQMHLNVTCLVTSKFKTIEDQVSDNKRKKKCRRNP